MDEIKLGNAWDLLNEFSSDEFKQDRGYYDILFYISNKIFDYRKKENLSQKKFAEMLSVNQAMISKLESGEYNPTIKQLWKIWKCTNLEFNININYNQAKNQPQAINNKEPIVLIEIDSKSEDENNSKDLHFWKLSDFPRMDICMNSQNDINNDVARTQNKKEDELPICYFNDVDRELDLTA